MGKKLGAKDYTDPKVQEALKDDAAFKATKDGLKDKERKVIMKPAKALQTRISRRSLRICAPSRNDRQKPAASDFG